VEAALDFQLMTWFALALGIGLLIGLERGWRMREEAPGSRAAGIRTFAISGLLGGVAASLGHSIGGAITIGDGIIIGASFAAYSAVMLVFCLEENRANQGISATTVIAAMLTFALGAYAVIGDMRVAAALAVVAVAILALHEPLHGWVENITWPELRSALVLLAMTFVVLPVIPDNPIGPFGDVNPREVWLIAIMLAGISFLGYAAVKAFGSDRGLLLAGAAGGIASSTVVTVANAHRAGRWRRFAASACLRCRARQRHDVRSSQHRRCSAKCHSALAGRSDSRGRYGYGRGNRWPALPTSTR
jgi:uncharacterized membrane protein (DUF4010 family)